MRRCLPIKQALPILVLFLCWGTLASGAGAAEGSGPQSAPRALREAVVSVEVAVDPVSLGPALMDDLAARRPWTAYEKELARRLRGVSRGSGFFVNAQGDLVTNAHVVLGDLRVPEAPFSYYEWQSLERLLETTRDVWVYVGEGEEARYYLAQVVALAEDLDLAVLRLKLPPGEKRPGRASEFSFLPIARSGGLVTGEPITALGFPENEYRATQGYVLSFITGTEVHGELKYRWSKDPVSGEETVLATGAAPGPIGRFQHSAPTLHGNSGGPVVDGRGRVVGVAYALVAEVDGGNQQGVGSLSLAIASDVLRAFLRQHAIPFTEAPGD